MAAGEVTELLRRLASGDKEAEAELMPRVYRELHRMARGFLRREREGHTLQPTALVHEAWLRLAGAEGLQFENRGQFFGIAGRAMRRILVDYARQRNAAKRAGIRLSLDESLAMTDEQCALVSDLNDALERLALEYPRAARVVELRYFGGLSEDEAAEVLGVATRTVKRDWKFARAWLYGDLAR